MRQQAIAMKHPTGAALAQLSNAHAALVLKSWWALGDRLIYKYADGNIYEDSTEYGPGKSSPAGYPVWWLEAVGYPDGPPPPMSGATMSSGRN